MSNLVLSNTLGPRHTLSEAYEQFQRELEKYAAEEAAGPEPVDEGDRPLRVLIVDDYRQFTDTLASLVRAWGHDVRCTYDGAAGLVLATEFKPDVVLLDSYLPGISGIELTLKVRQQKRLKHCFIIAVSGRTDSEHGSRCYEAGVDLFLTKPIRPSNIETLLMLEAEHVIQAKRRRRSERESASLLTSLNSHKLRPVRASFKSPEA